MKNCTLLLLLALGFFSYGQTYQTLNKIKVPEGREMIKKATVKNCPETVTSGQTVEIKKEFKDTSTKPETVYTVTETKAGPTTINVDKTLEIKLTSFAGDANIYVDETDKSKVHINYWLNGSYTVEKGYVVDKVKRTLKFDGTYRHVTESTINLTEETKYPYVRCEIGDTLTDYYKNSDVVYKVKNAAGILQYCLMNKYDQNADYTIQLENRELISFTNTAVEFGPITIPIKYRFGYGEGDSEVKEEFSADLNLGIFAGYRIGRYRARYERGVGFKELANLSCTIGGFLSASTVSLSKSNTNAGDNPITTDVTYTAGLISPGFGVMGSMYGFNLGLFLGWDIGVGKESNNWNFDGKTWLGVGIAYSLTSFWKK